MANKADLEQLFELPVIQVMFDGTAERSAEILGRHLCTEMRIFHQESIEKAVYKYIRPSMPSLYVALYENIFSNEDVQFLLEVLPNPVFMRILKFHEDEQTIEQIMNSWYEGNKEGVRQAIKAAVQEV